MCFKIKIKLKMENAVKITVSVDINAPIEKVWNYWTSPDHIMQWNQASDDWHTPHATNDLRIGGSFLSRMAAKDGSFSFDFEGVYSQVENHKTITYGLEDGRQVSTSFEKTGENATKVTTIFDAETENPVEMQQGGWQAIANNFKKHVENN